MTYLAQMRLVSLIGASLVTISCRSSGASRASTTPAGTPSPTAKPALPLGVTTAMIAEGDSIFNNRSCKN